jgi:hypothetical protein
MLISETGDEAACQTNGTILAMPSTWPHRELILDIPISN